MRRSSNGLILGYHGCDRRIADGLLAGAPFRKSNNPYDWLGLGAYFWENDPERALQWAKLMKQRRNDPAFEPHVVGCVIDPGRCLDLTTQASLEVIRKAYEGLKEVARSQRRRLVANTDFWRRELDCAVFNYLYVSMPSPKFQTVRGVLTEGKELYPGAHIQSKTHVQWAVRDLGCIKGAFRVRV